MYNWSDRLPQELLVILGNTNPSEFDIDEQTLVQLVLPDRRLRLLKTQFWLDMESNNQRIALEAMCFGIMPTSKAVAELSKPKALAWFLYPPVRYEVKMREALDVSVERLRNILDLPETKQGKDGRELNEKVINLKLKVMDMLDKRIHGAYTQRVESKNLNLTKNVGGANEVDDLEEIDRRIAALEKRDYILDSPNESLVIPKLGTRREVKV